SEMRFVFSDLRTRLNGSLRKLCKTSKRRRITYADCPLGEACRSVRLAGPAAACGSGSTERTLGTADTNLRARARVFHWRGVPRRDLPPTHARPAPSMAAWITRSSSSRINDPFTAISSDWLPLSSSHLYTLSPR